jgi:ribose transport system permease protein
MLAALALTVLQKVLFSTGVSSFYTGIFQGAIMIIAVIVAAVSARFSSESEARS